MTFGEHKLVRSEPFRTTRAKFDNTIAARVGPYLRSRHISTANGISLKSLLSIWSGAHRHFRPVPDFSQFLTEISRNLWRYLATKVSSLKSLWNGNPFRKEAVETASNRPINRDSNPVQSNSVGRPAAWQTNTILSHL